MKVGIMQPYFWPYLGYFQLINATKTFIVYDNIQYTKKGWFNRNRYLCNGTDKYFSIPIKKDSDFLDVCERKVSSDFNRTKLENQIRMAYAKAPFFQDIFPLFCDCVEYQNENLFQFIYYSMLKLVNYLGIETEIIISSSLGLGHELNGQDKVIELCKKIQGTEYINPSGGMSLYSKEEFSKENIKLSFIKMSDSVRYAQFDNEFVPSLSILDVLMFNSLDKVKEMLNQYVLL